MTGYREGGKMEDSIFTAGVDFGLECFNRENARVKTFGQYPNLGGWLRGTLTVNPSFAAGVLRGHALGDQMRSDRMAQTNALRQAA